MVKAKLGSPSSSTIPAGAGENISRLSASMFHDIAVVYKAWIDAGRANLMQGYASSIATADLMHSMGFMSNLAYDSINILSDIMDVTSIGTGVFTALFGTNALAPTLHTALDPTTGESEGGGEGDEKKIAGLIPLLANLGETAAVAAAIG